MAAAAAAVTGPIIAAATGLGGLAGRHLATVVDAVAVVDVGRCCSYIFKPGSGTQSLRHPNRHLHMYGFRKVNSWSSHCRLLVTSLGTWPDFSLVNFSL